MQFYYIIILFCLYFLNFFLFFGTKKIIFKERSIIVFSWLIKRKKKIFVERNDQSKSWKLQTKKQYENLFFFMMIRRNMNLLIILLGITKKKQNLVIQSTRSNKLHMQAPRNQNSKFQPTTKFIKINKNKKIKHF